MSAATGLESDFQPLKITFTLGSPVVLANEHALHLDALLAWSEASNAETHGVEDFWSCGDDLGEMLGIAHGPDGQWVWQASRLLFTPASDVMTMNMIRKYEPWGFMEAQDSGLIGTRMNQVNISTGPYKAYRFDLLYRWMEKVECWCIGDATALRASLDRVTGIGKMVRNGFGLVADYTIEEDAAALEKWKLRTMPLGFDRCPGIDYAEVMATVRVPYWQKLNQVHAIEPIV